MRGGGARPKERTCGNTIGEGRGMRPAMRAGEKASSGAEIGGLKIPD